MNSTYWLNQNPIYIHLSTSVFFRDVWQVIPASRCSEESLTAAVFQCCAAGCQHFPRRANVLVLLLPRGALFACGYLTLAPPWTALHCSVHTESVDRKKKWGLPTPKYPSMVPLPLSISPCRAGWISPGQKALWADHERPINHTASPRGPARRTPPPRMPLSQQAAIPACTASLQG